MSEKQPSLWKDLQKIDFKNSKEMLYDFFFFFFLRTRFSTSLYFCFFTHKMSNMFLGYMMQEHGSFPDKYNLRETLEFYFQQCALEVNCRQMSTVAATLANGGKHPKTGKRIFHPSNVR